MALKDLHHPHDNLFKEAMSNTIVARNFIEQHLPPALVARMDLSTLKLCSGTYVNAQLKATASDVLYSVQLDGHTAYVYMLAEHKSGIDVWMPVKILGYKVDIWKAHIKQHPKDKLPVIIPIVFYNGGTPYTASSRLSDLMEGPIELIEEYLHKDFLLIDTNYLEDEVLREEKWAGTLAFFMKHVHDRDIVESIRSIIGSLLWLIKAGCEDLVTAYLNYYMSEANNFNLTIYIDLIKKHLSEEIGEKVMNMAQQLRDEGVVIGVEKGVQQGIQQGMQQGMQQGEATMLLRQLQRKFGEVPAGYRAKIEAANDASLLAWGERLLEVSTLEALFKGPAH